MTLLVSFKGDLFQDQLLAAQDGQPAPAARRTDEAVRPHAELQPARKASHLQRDGVQLQPGKAGPFAGAEEFEGAPQELRLHAGQLAHADRDAHDPGGPEALAQFLHLGVQRPG
jgi:hypothetical protein